jgi:hypothetical protein
MSSKIHPRPPAALLPPAVRAPASVPVAAVPRRAPVENGPVLSPPPGAALAGVGPLGWDASAPSDYWLDATLLKPPVRTEPPLDDVTQGPPRPGVELPLLLPSDGREAVYEKLKGLPLSRLLTSPGYRYYRYPSAFPEVLEQVRTDHRVDTRPSILDVHTDGRGQVLNVDLRSHHLRMAAFIEVGATTLGDLPFDQLLIKVDGLQRGDTYFPMRAHGYALPPEILARPEVNLTTGDEPAEVELPNLQNWDLGSRTSLQRFHDTLLHRPQPKLGVVFGSGATAVERALKLRAEHGLDEVVIAPDGAPDAALEGTVLATAGLNLYLDAPAPLRQAFPDQDYAKMVKLRLSLTYGTAADAIAEEP